MGKRRRSKRLFPKNMQANFIPVPRVDPNKAAAYNAQRSKATSGPSNDVEHKPDNSFMEDVPKTVSRIVVWQHHRTMDPKTGKKRHIPGWYDPVAKSFPIVDSHNLMVVKGKKEERDTQFFYRVWQAERGQGIQEFHCRVMEARDNYKFMLFHSGDDYFFVQEVLFKNVRRISVMYKGLSGAAARKDSMNINWIVVERINPDTAG
jgi:hypothetical protein